MPSHSSVSQKNIRRGATNDRSSRRRSPQAEPPQPPARRGRRGIKLLFALAVMGVLIWLLPAIVARTPLLDWIMGRATADLNGTASIGSLSLGWFSPVEASGVKVKDKQGEVVAEVPELSSDKTLLKLATNWKQLGTFTLQRPTINVVLGPDGSNLEELIAKYMTGPSGEPVAVELKVVDATIHVHDQAGSAPWSIEKFNLTVTTSDQKDGPTSLTASGVVPGADQAGQFTVAATLGPDSRVQLQTQGFQTANLSALLARFVPGMKLSGRLNAQVDCRWRGATEGGGGPSVQLAAGIACTDFDLMAGELGTDRIHLAAMKIDTQVAFDGSHFVVDKALVQTDVGNVSLNGQFDVSGADTMAMLDQVLRQSFALQSEVDLVRLAAMLPGTLHLDHQTTVTQGRLKVDLANRPSEQGMVFHGNIEVAELAALHAGRSLAWQQPVSVSLDARQTPSGLNVDRLDCRSSFLTLNGSGNREKLAGTVRFDLDQLVQQLRGLVDLGGIQFAGNGSGTFAWQYDARQAFVADANMNVQELRVVLPNRPAWQENTITAKMHATGMTDYNAATRVDTAQLDFGVGLERLTVRLTQPIADMKSQWPLAVDTQGELVHWINRARAWNLLDGWDAGGSYRMTANLDISPSKVVVRDAQLNVNRLRLVGSSLNLDEPNTRLTMVGQYDVAQRRLDVGKARLETSALVAEVNGLSVISPVDRPLELAGAVAFGGDVARLQSWITNPGVSTTWRAYGQLQGSGQIKQVAGVMTGWLDATIAQLVLQSLDGKQFRDPTARLVVQGSFDPSVHRVKLDEVLVTTSAAGARASGQIDLAEGRTKVDLAGQLGCDWQKVVPLLQPYLGNSVKIAGRTDRTFSYRGPLDLATADATAAVDWQSMNAYGCQVGQGELALRLVGGTVNGSPLNLTVSEGRLVAKPRFRLSPKPMLAEVEPGQVLQQIRINPQMCAHGLQYIAPILAGVATAQGRFSMTLDQCRIRLDDSAKSDLIGRLTVHSVEVGPGALLRELAVVLNRATSAKLQQESTIRFRLANGRVYHEGLELVFPEMTIRTQGWVGLDQSLSMVAEMPIPPKWLIGNKYVSQALKSQVLKVPIRGTLNRPQIDHAKLDEYNRKLIQKATKNLLEGELNRLLGPPK